MPIPTIVGCSDATSIIQTGDVTVSCAEGEQGKVYAGLIPFTVEKTKLDNLPETKTKILMNVGDPESAFGLSALPCDGIGLTRLEFIIANQIKVHPLALLKFDELKDGAEFAEVFDGFSIGSNDLTQLTLGLDRDSALVSHLFDERNPAVEAMLTMAISIAKLKERKIGICGQAPSDYPEFAEFLVKQGIDSISLNPDTVLKTRLKIAEVEANIG